MHRNSGCPVISTAWRLKADCSGGANTASIIRQRICHGDVIGTGLNSPEVGNSLLRFHRQDTKVGIGILLLIVSVLLCTAALPAWPYNRNWGPQPSMSFGLLSALILVLLMVGRL
jgi:Protein of unknown function (DUF3309)